MANVYPFLDLGTWEDYIPNPEVVTKYHVSVGTITILTYQKSNDFASSGVSSGKLTYTAAWTGPTVRHAPIFYFNLIGLGSGSRQLLPAVDAMGGAASIVGRLIKIKCKVYTPSSNPIGSDDVKISLLPYITEWGAPVDWVAVNMPTPSTRNTITVDDCKDQWVELEFFITPTSLTQLQRVLTYLSVVCIDSESNFPAVAPFGLTGAGTLNVGGALYVDDISLEKVEACDIAFGAPSYSKTNETANNADNGTITVNATTSNGPLEYAIDGGSFQLSNVFNGLAPGNHNIVVRDSLPSCELELQNIFIVEYDVDPPPPIPLGPNLTVECKPSTQPNFIQWFAASGSDIDFTTWICGECCGTDIPNPYNVKRDKARLHAPVVAIGEEFTFYMNLKTPLTDPDYASFKLALIKETGSIVDDVAPLSIDMFEDNVTYQLYATVTISGQPIGYYRLAVWNQITGAVLFVSNRLELMILANAKCFSSLLRYRNTNTLYGIRYPSLPDFLNIHRLRIYQLEFQGEGDLEQYRAVSSGELRNVNYELDKAITLEMYWFDNHAHEAAMVWQMHNYLGINDKLYLPKGLYKIEWDVRRKLNKGKIEMFEQGFSTANRYGALDNVVVVGSDDGLLLGDGGGFIKL